LIFYHNSNAVQPLIQFDQHIALLKPINLIDERSVCFCYFVALMDIVLYLIVSFCSVLAILFLGNLLLGLITDTKNLQPISNTFISLLTGIVFIACSTALIRTGFKSILIGPILLFVIYFIINRANYHFKIRPLCISGQHIILLAAVILGFFIIQLLPILNLDTFQLKLPERDILFYGNLSESLQIWGFENTYGFENEINNSVTIAEPYHYFLEWFNSIFSFGSVLNSTYSIVLISSPVFSSIIVMGFGSVLENYFPNHRAILLISLGFIALFISGWIPTEWFQSQSFKELSNLQLLPTEHSSNLKVLPYYLFLIASIFFLIKGKTSLSFVTILSLIFLNPLFTPAIIIFFVLIIVWQLFNRNVPHKTTLNTVILLAISASTFFGFYWLFGNRLTHEISGTNLLFEINYQTDIYYLLSTIPQETMVTYSFWIITFLCLRFIFKIRVNKTIRAINFCAIGFYLITLILWTVFRYLGPDTFQLITVLGITVLNLALALNVIYLFLAIPKKMIRLTLTLICVSFISVSSYHILSNHSGHQKNYSSLFITEAFKLNEKYDNPNKLVLLDTASYNLTISNKYPILASTLCGGYFYTLSGQDNISSIDAPYISISTGLSADYERKIITSSTYYKFLLDIKFDRNSPLKYAQHTNSRMLICESSNRVPACFKLNELERLTDKNTGEVILVLKEELSLVP
jgi:hypothetical protein